MPATPPEVDPDAPSYSLYEGIEYEAFWQGSRKDRLDQLEHALVRTLLPHSGSRIIDIGCGYGRLADCYLGRFQQVIMVDGSMSLLRQAQTRTGGRAVYVACDATHLPFQPAAFDAALMIRVFQHIEDSRACLAEARRILCHAGTFVFSYGNKRNAWRVACWLMGNRAENPFTREQAGSGSTFISHHPKAVHQMLLEFGFSAIEYDGAGVLDWLASRMNFAGQCIPTGERLAPLLGRTKVAPWIFCRALNSANASIIGACRISDLLQCPRCGGNLADHERGYVCPACNTHFPVLDGIIDLRVQ